jgi:hypothetical protein
VGSIRGASLEKSHLFRRTTVMVTSEFRRKVLLCTRVNKSCSFSQIAIASTYCTLLYFRELFSCVSCVSCDEEEMDRLLVIKLRTKHSFEPRAGSTCTVSAAKHRAVFL